jgi:hypothetical protein
MELLDYIMDCKGVFSESFGVLVALKKAKRKAQGFTRNLVYM